MALSKIAIAINDTSPAPSIAGPARPLREWRDIGHIWLEAKKPSLSGSATLAPSMIS
jgi:hypothetical protein